jgi:hypothetical protein
VSKRLVSCDRHYGAGRPVGIGLRACARAQERTAGLSDLLALTGDARITARQPRQLRSCARRDRTRDAALCTTFFAGRP